MHILALDTSTSISAVAITDGARVLAEDDSAVISSAATEHAPAVPARHGQVLIPRIEAQLAAAQVAMPQLDLIAVGVGPGSFTGLRVGLATAKGLAFALQKPVRGVSSLDVIAVSALQHAPYAVVLLDAFKSEVYAGVFARASEPVGQGDPRALMPLFHASPADACARVLEVLCAQPHAPCMVVGDGARRYAAQLGPLFERGTLGPVELDAPRGAEVARAALRAFEREGPSDLASLEPSYVRDSDARLPARPLSVE